MCSYFNAKLLTLKPESGCQEYRKQFEDAVFKWTLWFYEKKIINSISTSLWLIEMWKVLLWQSNQSLFVYLTSQRNLCFANATHFSSFHWQEYWFTSAFPPFLHMIEYNTNVAFSRSSFINWMQHFFLFSIKSKRINSNAKGTRNALIQKIPSLYKLSCLQTKSYEK